MCEKLSSSFASTHIVEKLFRYRTNFYPVRTSRIIRSRIQFLLCKAYRLTALNEHLNDINESLNATQNNERSGHVNTTNGEGRGGETG